MKNEGKSKILRSIISINVIISFDNCSTSAVLMKSYVQYFGLKIKWLLPITRTS